MELERQPKTGPGESEKRRPGGCYHKPGFNLPLEILPGKRRVGKKAPAGEGLATLIRQACHSIGPITRQKGGHLPLAGPSEKPGPPGSGFPGHYPD